METLNLSKKVYSKTQYEKVINTDFSQLAVTPTATNSALTTPSPPTISVGEFFANYTQIFFTIPKLGATNSHEYLVKTSLEYIGTNPASNEINALIDEINILQQQNLELNQQIIDLQLPK
jgi:hypothetical protein